MGVDRGRPFPAKADKAEKAALPKPKKQKTGEAAAQFAMDVSSGAATSSRPPADAMEEQQALENAAATQPKAKAKAKATAHEPSSTIDRKRFGRKESTQIAQIVAAYEALANTTPGPLTRFGEPNSWLNDDKYKKIHEKAIDQLLEKGLTFAE